MLENEFNATQIQNFCIIGHPIKHSLSPIMHNLWFKDLGLNNIYTAFDVPPDKLKNAVEGIKSLNIKGFNITLPHKVKILDYVDEVNLLALKIGAINTIRNDTGYLWGRNTDAEGGMKALLNAGFTFSGKNILLIGAGGAGRALSFSIAENVNKLVIINRTENRAKKLAKEVKDIFGTNIKGIHFSNRNLEEQAKEADILINTTPIGMYPKLNESPIPSEFLHDEIIIFDVIYNPLETKLIKDAKIKGCKTLGGLDMLLHQGALAFEWWTKKKPNIELVKQKLIEYLGKK